MRILFITGQGFEDSELLCPKYRFEEEGFQVDIAAPDWGEVKGKRGYPVSANLAIDEAEPEAFDTLFIPGGKVAEKLAMHDAIVKFVQEFASLQRPIAAICHGPLLLASAGILKGRKATCYYKVSDKLQEAGAIYENSPVVVDNNIITSRQPRDIPLFMKEVVRTLKGLREA